MNFLSFHDFSFNNFVTSPPSFSYYLTDTGDRISVTFILQIANNFSIPNTNRFTELSSLFHLFNISIFAFSFKGNGDWIRCPISPEPAMRTIKGCFKGSLLTLGRSLAVLMVIDP